MVALRYSAPGIDLNNTIRFDGKLQEPHFVTTIEKISAHVERPPRSQHKRKTIVTVSVRKIESTEFISGSDGRLVEACSFKVLPDPDSLEKDDELKTKDARAVRLAYDLTDHKLKSAMPSSLKAQFGVVDLSIDLNIIARLRALLEPFTKLSERLSKVKEDEKRAMEQSLEKKNAEAAAVIPSPSEPPLSSSAASDKASALYGREFGGKVEASDLAPVSKKPKMSASAELSLSQMSDEEDSEEESFSDMDFSFWLIKINVKVLDKDVDPNDINSSAYRNVSLLLEVVKPMARLSASSSTSARQVIADFAEIAVYLHGGNARAMVKVLEVQQQSTAADVRSQSGEAISFTIHDPDQVRSILLGSNSSGEQSENNVQPEHVEMMDYKPNAYPKMPSGNGEHPFTYQPLKKNPMMANKVFDAERSGPYSEFASQVFFNLFSFCPPLYLIACCH